MKATLKLLQRHKERHDKVLLFSSSCQLLDILQQMVISQGYSYNRLDGSTPLHERQTMVKEFNGDSNKFVFLISTKAGGLGLNLTSANIVIIYNPTWNPSDDMQAQDRAYRMGQTKNVTVYRLVSMGTIEEQMYLRQVYKHHLNQSTIENVQAKRIFEGVAKDSNDQGQIFGYVVLEREARELYNYITFSCFYQNLKLYLSFISQV